MAPPPSPNSTGNNNNVVGSSEHGQHRPGPQQPQGHGANSGPGSSNNSSHSGPSSSMSSPQIPRVSIASISAPSTSHIRSSSDGSSRSQSIASHNMNTTSPGTQQQSQQNGQSINNNSNGTFERQSPQQFIGPPNRSVIAIARNPLADDEEIDVEGQVEDGDGGSQRQEGNVNVQANPMFRPGDDEEEDVEVEEDDSDDREEGDQENPERNGHLQDRDEIIENERMNNINQDNVELAMEGDNDVMSHQQPHHVHIPISENLEDHSHLRHVHGGHGGGDGLPLSSASNTGNHRPPNRFHDNHYQATSGGSSSVSSTGRRHHRSHRPIDPPAAGDIPPVNCGAQHGPSNLPSRPIPHEPTGSTHAQRGPANLSSHSKDAFDMQRFSELITSRSGSQPQGAGRAAASVPYNAPTASPSTLPLPTSSNFHFLGGFPSSMMTPRGASVGRPSTPNLASLASSLSSSSSSSLVNHSAARANSYNNSFQDVSPAQRGGSGAAGGGGGSGGPTNVFNWQASKGSVRERMKAIFNQETLADVHFILGRGPEPPGGGCGPPIRERVPAHKFVLSIGSAVFDAMFNGNLATHSEEIELPDVEPAAFLALLRFLYTDEVQIGPETVMTTLYTAKKYAVPALERACVEFLKSNLTPDNAFMLLTQARLFDEPVLARMCLDIIDKQTVEALAAEGFLDIDHPTLCAVLERDTLRIREVGLFNAVVRWAEQECARRGLPSNPDHQRDALGGALTLIRFPLMTVEEFAVDVAQSGLLLDREVVEIFLYFTINPKPSIPFPDNPRCCITGKEQCVNRFLRTESRWGYSGTSDRIRFTVDKRIFVMGFGLYGSIHGPSDYDCNIQIIQTGTGKVLASNDTTFSCDGSATTSRVMFKLPVEINPNTNYTACTTLKGSDSHYGTGGIRKVVADLHGGGKVTFQFAYAAGCNNGTSVEDGQIPEIIFYT